MAALLRFWPALMWTGNPTAAQSPLSTGNVLVGNTSGVNSALLIASNFGGNAGGTLNNNIIVQAGSAGGVVGELGPGNTSGGFTYKGITLSRNVWLGNGLTGGGGGAFSGNITDAPGTANTVSLITGNGTSGTVPQNITGTGNTWGGGTIVHGGLWAVSASSKLGTGSVTVNGGILRS